MGYIVSACIIKPLECFRIINIGIILWEIFSQNLCFYNSLFIHLKHKHPSNKHIAILVLTYSPSNQNLRCYTIQQVKQLTHS